MSKREIVNDFIVQSNIKRRRRFKDPTMEEAERGRERDSFKSLNTLPRRYQPIQNIPDDSPPRPKAGINTAPAGGAAATGKRKKDVMMDDSPPRRSNPNGIPAVHNQQRMYSGSHKEAPFSSRFSSRTPEEDEAPSTWSDGVPPRLSSRHLGRGFLTGSMTATTLPPLSSVAAERMRPTSYPVGHHSIHSQPQPSLSALTSYYYNLLDSANQKSVVDEELALARRLNLLQRDILLSPDDLVPLSWAPHRLGRPTLLPSLLSRGYSDPGAIATTTNNLATPSERIASLLSTRTADMLEPPQHTSRPLFRALEDNQARLQAELLASDYYSRRGSYASRVESQRLTGDRNLKTTGAGKVVKPLQRHDHAGKGLLEKELPLHGKANDHHTTRGSLARLLPIPPTGKDIKCPHFSERQCLPLATDEDPNWLSEFLCFVRSDIIEVFRASEDDVKCRNNTKKVNLGQVGIRCRFCAHVPSATRTRRSSSFPFTLSRIYQSLTMMLRDHFGFCPCMPDPIKERFLRLKGKTPQGASGSNQFWESSARKLGLEDSELGIWVKETSTSPGKRSYSDKHDAKMTQSTTNKSHVQMLGYDRELASSSLALDQDSSLLVKPEDRTLVSDFLHELLTHVQLIRLDESERMGNRKNLQVGTPGLGCRYCCQSNRRGLCRAFPARRRTLSGKLSDLYEHIRRCSLCPKEQRERLIVLNKYDEEMRNKKEAYAGDAAFLDRLWERMTFKSK